MNVYTAKELAYGQHILRYMFAMTAMRKIKNLKNMSRELAEALFIITYIALIVGNYIRITI